MAIKSLCCFLKARRELFIVLVVFIVSRIVYSLYFGMHFDDTPLYSFSQYIDISLLKGNLMQSLYYLHSQPPGFNLFLGIVLKFFPQHLPDVFHLLYLILGLILSFSIFLIMKEMRVRSFIALSLTALFIASPIVFKYENWLFYEYPTAAFLALSLLCLQRFMLYKRTVDCFNFFLLLTIIIYTRGLFSLYWFLLVLLSLLAINRQDWKKILGACLLPAILLFALYTKNFMVFNSFSVNDAEIGVNLARAINQSLPPNIVDDLISKGEISGLVKIEPFSTDLSLYTHYGIRQVKTGIPVLDDSSRDGQYGNTHNLIYLDASRVNIRDAVYVFRNYMGYIFKNRKEVFLNNYFLPSDQCEYFYAGGESKQVDRFYKKFILWSIGKNKFLLLILGLPVLFVYAFYKFLRSFCSKSKDFWMRSVFAFILISIIYLTVITVFAWTDYSRYRFLVDSFYLVLFGILINDLVDLFFPLIGK